MGAGHAPRGGRHLGLALFALTNFAFTISGWARATVTASTHQSWFVLAALALLIALASWSLRRRTA